MMQEDRASATALGVARRRALHQLVDRPKVFDDPLAVAVLGPEEADRLRSADVGSASSRGLRAYLAARSRYAEDQLAGAYARGVRQYVLLGAGLDTFAYRNPHPGLRVFELDHPATQAMKQRRLASAGIAVPESARLVPVDFARQSWVEALTTAPFEAAAPTCFAWLGVAPYLEESAVLATLRAVLELSRENAIVFDYAVPRSSLGFLGRMAFDAMAARVAKVGEPFRCFFAPERLASELARFGFVHVEDIDGERINDRYFRDRSDGLRVRGRLARFVFASGTFGRPEGA